MRTQPSARGVWSFRRLVWLIAGLALGSMIWLPADGVAQDRRPRPRDDGDRHGRFDGHDHEYRRGSRVQLGGGFVFVAPQGVFGDFVDDGWGVDLNVVYGLDPSNVIGLRFDAGWVRYGSEHVGAPLFPGTGRVLLDVGTHNNIAMFGIGPQIQVPAGPIRPYINGFVGMGYFYTESSLHDGYYYYDEFHRTTNFDDVSFGYGGGGGLALLLGRGRTPLSVNFDVQYRKYDDTEYLVEGSIWDDGFGGAVISPLFSDVEMLHFSVGLSVGL